MMKKTEIKSFNIYKNENAITMIALIITIIILLILAGITIATLTGENGILKRATIAINKTNEASAKEKLQIELVNIQSEKMSKGKNANLISLDEKIEELKDKGIIVENSGTPRNVIVDGYTFKVKDDLTIEGEGISVGITNGGNTSLSSGVQIDFYGGKIYSPFSGGDGSESNPYLIESEAQLKFLSVSVNEGLNTYEGKYIKLNNDIQLDSNKQWTPIGNETTEFKGMFNGNGKTISGIYISNSLTNQGLFGIVGESGIIYNTKSEGSITASGTSGGIVGNNKGTIKRCTNNVKVSKAANIWILGGVTGKNEGTVIECINNGEVTGYDTSGGIAGINFGIIKKCINKGKITSSYFTAGGIVGLNGYYSTANPKVYGTGYIYNCYNIGTITAPSYVGGLIGAQGYNSSVAKSYIYNSYSINTNSIVGGNLNGENINCYTTDANTKLTELNAGIDDATANTDTEQPWVEDKENINEGYPILSW